MVSFDIASFIILWSYFYIENWRYTGTLYYVKT